MSDRETSRRGLNGRTAEIGKLIETYLPEETGHQKAILEVISYSIRADGKRLRPTLVQEIYCLSTDCLLESMILFMTAVEMTHTPSFVHDDLPCMDNDIMRKGGASTWAELGKGIGVLAEDALMVYAFETASCASETSVDPDELSRIGEAIGILARETGMYDIISGQTMDAELAGGPIPADKLNLIYRLKTDALIGASMLIGIVLDRAADEGCEIVESLAPKIGMAFRIQGDILDVTSSKEIIDEPINSDERSRKAVYVILESLEKAKQDVEKISAETIEELSKPPGNNDFLEQLIHLLIRGQK